MNNILNEIKNDKLIAIGGHVRPDGDCVGSCMALYHYLKLNLPVDARVDVFLEPIAERFHVIEDVNLVKQSLDKEELVYDVFIALDSGSLDRLGDSIKYFETAKRTINIDHHISNTNYANTNHVIMDASSTCEVLFDLFEEDKINTTIAKALYLGIIHDTGVFKHSNTSRKTMDIAGRLIEKDIPFSKLIDETFYLKTHLQNQILGYCLMKSMLVLEGSIILSYLKKDEMEKYQVSSKDLDGVIDQLRITSGVEVAIFIYETDKDFKVSMRSNGLVDVRKIAEKFAGGGHIKAAGCSMSGTIHDIINSLTGYIECQLKQN